MPNFIFLKLASWKESILVCKEIRLPRDLNLTGVPRGGTLGISRWGCAARTLEPLAYTVEPQLSGPRLSGLFDYPDFFSGPVFFMNINKL